MCTSPLRDLFRQVQAQGQEEALRRVDMSSTLRRAGLEATPLVDQVF